MYHQQNVMHMMQLAQEWKVNGNFFKTYNLLCFLVLNSPVQSTFVFFLQFMFEISIDRLTVLRIQVYN